MGLCAYILCLLECFIEKDNIRKASTKINTKKVMKRINSNRTSLKIPKNIPNNINTSKYIHTKEKKIPKFTRYNSLKYLNNGKSRKNNTSINSIKESVDALLNYMCLN